MSCATPNARCWWCGISDTGFEIAGVTDEELAAKVVARNPAGLLGRRFGKHWSCSSPTFPSRLTLRRIRAPLTPMPANMLGIVIEAVPTPHTIVDRGLDMTASKPDIAQSTIVHFSKRFDPFPARQISGQAIGPDSDPADKSARPAGSGWPCRGRGNRAHSSSPIGFRRQSDAIGANAARQRLHLE